LRHGGNVALYALRDKAVAALVSEIIFLGTPFFRFVRMDVRPAVRLFARVVGFLTFASAVSLAVIAAGRYLPGIWSRAAAWVPDVHIPEPLVMPLATFFLTVIVTVAMMTFYFLPRALAMLVEKRFGVAIL
jgi:hypothetical protein